MTEKKKPGRKNPDARELRKQAEKIAREKPENLEPLSPAEARKLIHELSVHQIELEMQNDELRAAEQRLEEAREQYFNLYDMAPVGYFSIGENGTILEANLTGATLLGVSPRDLRSRQFTSWIFEGDQYIYYRHRQQLITTQEPQVFEARIVRKDGTLFWARVETALTQAGKSGEPVLRATMSDVTESNKARETLMESESRYRALFEHSLEFIYLHDFEGNFIEVNQAALDLFGYQKEEIGNINFVSLLSEDQLPLAFEALGEIRRIGYRTKIDEYRLRRKDGEYIDIETRGTAVRKDGIAFAVLGIARNITDRKQAEKFRQESAARLQEVLDNSLDASYKRNLQTNAYDYLSPTFVRISGYAPDEMNTLPLETVLNLIHPDDSTEVQRMIAESLSSTDNKPYRLEYRFKHKQGHYRWVHDSYAIMRDRRGQPLALIGSVSDITERKQAEQELRQREQDYSTLVENIPDMIVRFDTGLRHIFCNAAVEHHLGVTGNMFIGKTPLEIAGPDKQAQFVDKALRHTLETGVEQHVEQRYPSPTGERLFSTRIMPERDDKGRIKSLLAISSDITDHKRLEEEHQRVEKLEAVGVLAGGIAHDFNNILTAILGNISVARMEAAPGSEIHESLEQAEKASLRAKALTKQLLTFSKGGAPVKKLGSLTEMLKDTAGFALRGSMVKCHFYIPDDLWHAEIDEGQVSQVIHNLIVNAQQAMPAGGNIELTAENMCLSESQGLGMSLPLKAGDYVRIAVADHGSGIPAEIIDKIFDPFFSTKPKGSGLGLATSFSIARQHGGHLSVESEPGTGTTFYLYLPASTETAITKQDKKETIKPDVKARILVMDDEKGVREVAGRMLNHIGYKDIEFAADGAEAIKLYKAAIESGRPFNMAILDLTIPGGIGGEVAVKHLLDMDPSIKAIVSSGYIDDPVMARYGEYGFSGVVAKPYTIPELRKAVQDVIG